MFCKALIVRSEISMTHNLKIHEGRRIEEIEVEEDIFFDQDQR